MQHKFEASFYEGGIFHVYNRTNNKELLFKSDDNRLYFLKQYANYVQPFADTFCWCLLPTHFHFLIQVKSATAISQYLQAIDQSIVRPIEKKYINGAASADELIVLEWKRFFTSYSMAFNKQHGRNGNLFHRPFKRVEVHKDSHFTQAVIYIHANAMKHKLCKDFTQYPWSSWHSLISDKPTLLCRKQLLDWFGGRDRMISIHQSKSEYYYASDVGIEEE